MEDSPQKTDSSHNVEDQKQLMKERVTQVFKNYQSSQCNKKNCINPYWKMYLRKELQKKEEEEISQQDCLKAAVKIVKANSSRFEIPIEWPPEPLNGEDIDELIQCGDDAKLLTRITEVFWNLESLSLSFFPIEQRWINKMDNWTADIDFIRLEKIYASLLKLSESESGIYEKIMRESIENIKSQIDHYRNKSYKLSINPFIRVITLWLSQERLYDPIYEFITSLVADYFYELEEAKYYDRNEAEKFFSKLDYDAYITVAKVNQQQLTFLLFDQPDNESEEIEKVKRYFLIIDFFYFSSRHRVLKKISCKEFHLDLLNREWSANIPDFYIDWYKARRRMESDDMELDEEDNVYELDKKRGKFYFLNFPWAFDAGSKSIFLKIESQISRKREVHSSIRNILDILEQNFYLAIVIDRNNLVEDSLNQLLKSTKDLKKPLKVKFKGEPGVDAGGVQKEFFQLLVRDLFDVGYGMFDYNEESRLYWFKKDTFESPIKFELTGIILGLSIYNGHILDIHFPSAVYKKLLGKEITVEDYGQYDPQGYKTLKAILNYEQDDISETMGLSFVVDYDSWGTRVSEELKDGGKNILVTQENKAEYVELYINFMMNVSVSKWFNSFKKGFINWCGGEILSVLEPEDLEMLICGSKILDFSKLRDVTVYQDGYTVTYYINI